MENPDCCMAAHAEAQRNNISSWKCICPCHIGIHIPNDVTMVVDAGEAEQLLDYFSHQYIDHTEFPLVHNFLRRLQRVYK